MKIALLHTRYVPAVAGVELILEQHARLFAEAGHEVTVLTGSGESRDDRVRVEILPELASPTTGAEATEAALRPYLEGVEAADCVFAHNVLTMPFHLGCTAALWRLADRLPPGRVINWVHDLAAANPDYRAADYLAKGAEAANGKEGWALLSRRHPAMRVVAISEWRAAQFEELTGEPVDAVIPNGIDPLGHLNLTPRVAQLAAEHRLLDSDVILFQPTRILRRKNIELGLRLVAELIERGCRARLLITGAPDGHNPASAAYHAELLDLRERLGLGKSVLFLSELFPVAKGDLAALYTLADVLWFPSKQEGFGLPVLEGVLHRLPVYCADLPPMNAFGLPGVEFFDPAGNPAELSGHFLRFLEKHSAFLQTRRAVAGRFSWEVLWPKIEALLRPFDPNGHTGSSDPTFQRNPL